MLVVDDACRMGPVAGEGARADAVGVMWLSSLYFRSKPPCFHRQHTIASCSRSSSKSKICSFGISIIVFYCGACIAAIVLRVSAVPFLGPFALSCILKCRWLLRT